MFRKSTTATLFAILSLPLIAHAAPGDLCRALNSPTPSVDALQTALTAGEEVNTLCGTISAAALAMRFADTNQAVSVFLINQGADPNLINSERAGSWGHSRRYLTNLDWAAARAPLFVLQAFLARKPDLNYTPHGQTALGWAMQNSRWDNARALISAGADIYSLSTSLTNGTLNVTDSALSMALKPGAPADLAHDLLAGWDFSRDALNINRYFVTMLRYEGRTADSVAFLVTKGANPRAIPIQDGTETALAYFAENVGSEAKVEDGKISEYLLSLGLNVNEGPGFALNNAVSRNSSWLVTRLLDAGADVNARVNDTPILHQAVYSYNPDLIRLLLKRGAKINAQDPDGHTALFEAIYGGYTETSLELIWDGANVNLASKDGITPLCAANSWSDAKVIKLLKSKGARLGRCNLN